MKDIKSMNLDELKEVCVQMGEKPFHAKQLYGWIHQKLAPSYQEMTTLSKGFRQKLEEAYPYRPLEIVEVQTSKLDGPQKYLVELADGNVIESVLMRYHHGNSVCISSQVGCRMGCRFCASTIGGLVRSLTAGEMLDQIYQISRHTGERVSNVVVMGTGEPLDNYENVLRFLQLVTDERGLNISMRHISLSTCGVVPRIYDLAKEHLGLTLSVSLHAPNDEIRSGLMPVNRTWGIDELLRACRFYTKETSRRISFEYTMIDGVNDSDACAEELAARLHGMLCHVNLIPVNTVREKQYQKSRADRLRCFSEILQKRGLTVTVRRTLGEDINASCGQLRAAKMQT